MDFDFIVSFIIATGLITAVFMFLHCVAYYGLYDKLAMVAVYGLKVFLFLFVCAFSLYVIFYDGGKNKKKGAAQLTELLSPAAPAPMTLGDSVFNYIKQVRLQHPEIVYRQFQLETANFTSKLFREGNNICGMKYPEKRMTSAVGKYISADGAAYAKYTNWRESVLDYALWQSIKIPNRVSKTDFLECLNNIYAEDENYIQKLTK